MSDLRDRLDPVKPMADDTRQLAIAGVIRRVPAEHVAEVLAALGLAELPEPERPVPDTVYCACGKRIKARGVDRCSACHGGRTKSATGGDT